METVFKNHDFAPLQYGYPRNWCDWTALRAVSPTQIVPSLVFRQSHQSQQSALVWNYTGSETIRSSICSINQLKKSISKTVWTRKTAFGAMNLHLWTYNRVDITPGSSLCFCANCNPSPLEIRCGNSYFWVRGRVLQRAPSFLLKWKPRVLVTHSFWKHPYLGWISDFWCCFIPHVCWKNVCCINNFHHDETPICTGSISPHRPEVD